MEENMREWLSAQSRDGHITKAIFEIDMHTKITPVVRLYPVQRDGQTWKRIDTVESKRTVITQEFVQEDSKGLDFESFDFDELELESLGEPLREALSFALKINVDMFETIDSPPLGHHQWVVLP
ncbi:MAG: hypothetical protein ACI9S8_000297 [Chlamydiales bacterium]